MDKSTTKWLLGSILTFAPEYRRQLVVLLFTQYHDDALCPQTEIYEAEYQTEHNKHKHTLQDNQRLRKKREEMRQQVNLLQEQVVFKLKGTLIFARLVQAKAQSSCLLYKSGRYY